MATKRTARPQEQTKGVQEQLTGLWHHAPMGIGDGNAHSASDLADVNRGEPTATTLALHTALQI